MIFRGKSQKAGILLKGEGHLLPSTMDGGTGEKKRKSDALGEGLVPRVALKRNTGAAADTSRNALAISNDETKEARVVLLPSSVGDGGVVTVDLLPATVWGHVMDYLSFTDVLACLWVNRLLSFEAPKYVQYLCIFKPQELQVSHCCSGIAAGSRMCSM